MEIGTSALRDASVEVTAFWQNLLAAEVKKTPKKRKHNQDYTFCNIVRGKITAKSQCWSQVPRSELQTPTRSIPDPAGCLCILLHINIHTVSYIVIPNNEMSTYMYIFIIVDTWYRIQYAVNSYDPDKATKGWVLGNWCKEPQNENGDFWCIKGLLHTKGVWAD